jgi:hypothetical protein
MGGALFNMQGTVAIANSTFTGNSAVGGTPGFGGFSVGTPGAGLGGGIFNLNGTVSIVDATIDGNVGGGIYNLGYDSAAHRTASVTISGTLVSQNGTDLTSDAPATTAAGANASGANVDASAGDDIMVKQAAGAGTIAGSPRTADPKLGPLAANGGPGMFTQALPATSPAVDTRACQLSTDERGLPRPDDGEHACDIGAFELQDPPSVAPVITTLAAHPACAPSRGSIVFSLHLSEAASITYAIERVKGAARSTCAAKRHHAAGAGATGAGATDAGATDARAAAKHRPVSSARLTRSAKAGKVRIPLKAITAGKALTPGTYKLTVQARAGNLRSAKLSLRFYIRR